jgi:glycosyltransferase involved in cell wall biosynthesis
MKISICIPQYNRCAYLVKGLESIRAQTHTDFEVVVSDDGSTDGSREEIPRWLAASGLDYQYIQQPKNLGYDANLRAALAAGRGDYLFIMGNDDALPGPNTLAEVAALLEKHQPDLAIGNVIAAATGDVVKRVARTHAAEGGPDRAVTMFRALSCVTGLIFSREAFARTNTPRYDGSIYVQMYMGTSIIAGGGRVLTIDEPVAKTGTDVGGKAANSYLDTLSKFYRKILPATGGLDEVGRVVCEAIWPHVPASERTRITTAVFSQLLTYSYAFWLYDYRKHGAPWAALNLAIGCFPPRLLRNTDRSLWASASLAPFYLGATSGMVVPIAVLERVKDVVRNYAIRQR